MNKVKMKGITCCGDCAYYDWKKHKCSRLNNAGEINGHFYENCPLPDVVEKKGELKL